MINNKRVLAIIPARGGSKRLPHKNILELNGKPLIQWTIEAALKSEYIDVVCVSTDNENIVRISKDCGADVPFIRPEHLSTDTATSFDVVKHALDFYKQNNISYDYFILLQPTSPLRDEIDINDAFTLFVNSHANNVVSVTETEHSPLWTNTLPENLSLENFIPEKIKHMRSQDLPIYYRLNGAIYICNADLFLKEKSFIFNTDSYALIMKREKSIDIDTSIDFQLANIILQRKLANMTDGI